MSRTSLAGTTLVSHGLSSPHCTQAERRALRRISKRRALQHNPTGQGFPTWDLGIDAPLPASLIDRNYQRNRRLAGSPPYMGGAPYLLIGETI